MRELLDVKRRLTYVESLARYIRARDWGAEHEWRVPLLWRQLADELELLKEEMELAWGK